MSLVRGRSEERISTSCANVTMIGTGHLTLPGFSLVVRATEAGVQPLLPTQIELTRSVNGSRHLELSSYSRGAIAFTHNAVDLHLMAFFQN